MNWYFTVFSWSCTASFCWERDWWELCRNINGAQGDASSGITFHQPSLDCYQGHEAGRFLIAQTLHALFRMVFCKLNYEVRINVGSEQHKPFTFRGRDTLHREQCPCTKWNAVGVQWVKFGSGPKNYRIETAGDAECRHVQGQLTGRWRRLGWSWQLYLCQGMNECHNL